MKCGIQINTDNLSFAIVSNDGEFVFRHDSTLPTSEAEIVQLITALVKQLDPAYTPSSIGIAIPGLYNTKQNHIHCPNIPILHHLELKYSLQASLNMNVSIASFGQALCAAHQEKYPDENIFALHCTTDVSAGLSVAGRLVLGAHGIAGNWGHISLPWPVEYELDGRVCWCGKSGCLAHFVSIGGIEHDYELLTSSKATADEIISRSKSGDIVAESVLQVLEDRIARGLAMICNLLDPHTIILGGYLADIDRLPTSIPRKWPGYSQIGNLSVPVQHSAYDDTIGLLIGASKLHH